MTEDLKQDIDTVEEVTTPSRFRSAPQWIRDMPTNKLAERERRIRKKIDLRLLPMIVVMYILNYLDRNNIAAAKLAGLISDLHLVGNQFNTSVSILFAGYLVMQIPSNMLLNKLGRPSLYLPACMMVWGLISGLAAACTSYGGLLTVRFLLGFVEAAYFPGCLYFLSCWYTRKELAFRTGFLYSGSLLSGAFGGLIAAGITSRMDGVSGLSAWRWLFIIEGCMTIVVAMAAIFMLPDLPRTTRWLTEEEKAIAAWRLEADIGEDDWIDTEHQHPLHGLKLAIKDIKTWLILIVIYGSTASGSMATFFPTVVKGLGKNNVDTLLLTTPSYLIAVCLSLTNAWYADKTGRRFLHIACPPILAIAMYIVAVSTTAFAPRYVAMCLMVGGTYSGYVVALGYISIILPRPVSKRATALALINSLSNVCQIYSPYLYPNSAAPQYTTAFSVNIAMSAMTIIFATILRFYLAHLNKRLDCGDAVADVSPEPETSREEHGLPGAAVERRFRFQL
ncbi:Pantothenate transporter liz1 [Pleurostoma richardsiae]|uniref:Pantothenate transporter liz1 n=1 Tax=Pleurostoma richardsiae TaxID=41990 RepID=A0AA38RLW7_9PEZI|nr:Pantothenate transporter liz1 [Pleurostoma richardsiae]